MKKIAQEKILKPIPFKKLKELCKERRNKSCMILFWNGTPVNKIECCQGRCPYWNDL